ncbi:MAG: dockerin type I repeat-containing protein, partial [Clostridia bacterium]|nr:dockerin type I repeat-containing protein [Clostridia bacterium]
LLFQFVLMMAILQDMKTHENLHIIIIKGTIFDALKLWIVRLQYQNLFKYTDPYVTNEPYNILYGDVNGDGKVSARDSMLVQRYAIKLATLTDELFKAADVDKNGKVNAKDALYILRCSINMAVLPVEK